MKFAIKLFLMFIFVWLFLTFISTLFSCGFLIMFNLTESFNITYFYGLSIIMLSLTIYVFVVEYKDILKIIEKEDSDGE